MILQTLPLYSGRILLVRVCSEALEGMDGNVGRMTSERGSATIIRKIKREEKN